MVFAAVLAVMKVFHSQVIQKLTERDTIGKLTEELLEIVDNLSD